VFFVTFVALTFPFLLRDLRDLRGPEFSASFVISVANLSVFFVA